MQIKTETIVGCFIIASLGALFYMTLQIGAFRLNKNQYNPYYASFKDVSGLSKKADVKIAGVSVGWIDDLELVNEGKEVRTRLMISKKYHLHQDAEAFVRQEGLLGTKYLEVITGDPILPDLPAGALFKKSSKDSASFESMIDSFSEVVGSVKDIAASIKDALGSGTDKNNLKDTLVHFDEAVKNIAHVASSLNCLIDENKGNIGLIAEDMKVFMHDLKEAFPGLSEKVNNIAHKLDTEILPQLSSDFHRVSNTLNDHFLPQVSESAQDIARSISVISNAAQSFTESIQPSISNLNDITTKINSGSGALGKIINDDTIYADIQQVTGSLKSTLSCFGGWAFIVDGHFECLRGLENCYRDNKGYLNLRIHPCPEYYLLVGAAISQEGYVKRKAAYYKFKNKERDLETCDDKAIEAGKGCIEKVKQKRNSAAVNLQFARIWNNVAVRVGMFEGTIGGAVDWIVPIESDACKWVTTFEIFDFRGNNRLYNDDRPHLKWLNKLYFAPNLYVACGLDDFASKHTKSGFIGAGLRFATSDLTNFVGSCAASGVCAPIA